MSEGLEVLTEQIPFILVLEDLHWSDVSTLDLLSSLAQRTEPARLLIIGTYRPEEGLAEGYPLRAITQELQGHRQCEELALSLLSEAAVREYIQQRFPAAMLPTRLPETLHRNTEGSPLFVTAVVDDLLERGVITQIEGRWVLQGPVDALAAEVPVSIRQLLTRQIDRLNEQRTTDYAGGECRWTRVLLRSRSCCRRDRHYRRRGMLRSAGTAAAFSAPSGIQRVARSGSRQLAMAFGMRCINTSGMSGFLSVNGNSFTCGSASGSRRAMAVERVRLRLSWRCILRRGKTTSGR